MPREVEITVASDTRWLALVRRVVEEFCKQAHLDAQETHCITVAVGEAASNVVRHSYKGDPSKTFSLSCYTIDGGIEIELKDQGEPFNAYAQAIPPPDELRAGGRGIYLMRAVMDDVEYGRDGNTNFVRMRKLLKTPVK